MPIGIAVGARRIIWAPHVDPDGAYERLGQTAAMPFWSVSARLEVNDTMYDRPLATRVRNSLRRLGYELDVTDRSHGAVELRGVIRYPSDHALLIATTKTVAGVTSVSLELNRRPTTEHPT